MGDWYDKPEGPHEHDYPIWVSPGDGGVVPGWKWRCSCGRRFVVTKVKYTGINYRLTYKELSVT